MSSGIMVYSTISHHRSLLITHMPNPPKPSLLGHLWIHRGDWSVNVDDRLTSIPLEAVYLVIHAECVRLVGRLSV